ncbi:MHYT domain-containing protein [Actinoallomurus bryophytorum]|uniref:MHYT domain-containing protein n=1 Tax=Actinoallomurus bryophytorum TaxID=1490222 RepID=UPI00163978C1|nr:MHYT domain-containing protein [Actinoallomurus bryophytorum]
MGWFTPVLAYAASVTGSLFGLLCTVRAQQFRSSGQHVRWLLLAALAIGGTGIWLMHFSAMMGFGVRGSVVRYGILLTGGSAIVAVVVVGCGLFIVGYGEPTRKKVIWGGVFTGLGIAGMHYMGMAGMRVHGEISYSVPLVAASLLIAIVAATVALWFTVSLRTPAALTAAALIMGIAVCGMHYTGMAALRVRLVPDAQTVTGVDPISFMVPVIVVAFIILTVLLLAVITGPTTEDVEIRNQLFERPPSAFSPVDLLTGPQMPHAQSGQHGPYDQPGPHDQSGQQPGQHRTHHN